MIRYIAVLSFSLVFCTVSWAQAFPAKPVEIVVPFAPGGGTDIVARAISPKMSQALGVPVVIQNKPGAGGSLGTSFVARAPADGYTMLLVSSATAISNTLDKNITWNLRKNFQPVALLLFNQSLLVANPALPVSSAADVVALAKKKPGKLTFSSSGFGSSAHLGMELFKLQAGVDILHVPYAGAAPALNALMGGQVDLMLVDASVAQPQIGAGKIKVLGAGSPKRLASMPEIPTVSESGVPGFEVAGLIGLIVPAGTPPDAIQRLNKAANFAINDPGTRKRLESMSMIMEGGPPDRLGDALNTDIEKWARVIKSLKPNK